MADRRGVSYLETVIALGILAVVAAGILPLYSRLLSTTRHLKDYAKLTDMTYYVGNYLFRWADFSPASKPKALNAYADGEELEISQEKRINRLLWAEPLKSSVGNITDEFKVSMTFGETVSRNNSAVVKVVVWYDKNLDNVRNSDERAYTFSTIVCEKRNP